MTFKKPYLLYVIAEDRGLFTHRIDLARRAQKAGYKVGIACKVTDYADLIRKEKFELHPLEYLKRGSLNPLRDLMVLFELWNIYRKVRPTLVHQVALKPVLYGTFAARLARIPSIVNALGGLGYVFMTPSFKMRSLKYALLKAFQILFCHKKTILILQNPDDKRVFKNVLPEDQIFLVRGSGVNLKEFYPSQKQVEKEKGAALKVIMCARLLWDKGIGDLVEAGRILSRNKSPLRIQIVGENDPENPSSISSQVLEKWRLENHVDFLGRCDEQIPTLLRNADIAVLPSYREGLPKALLEAAATALPLVATDVPGCREVVQNGINGFLVPPGSPQDLAEALFTLAQEKKLRQEMGQASLKLVQENFSEEKINKEILEIYKGLIKPENTLEA